MIKTELAKKICLETSTNGDCLAPQYVLFREGVAPETSYNLMTIEQTVMHKCEAQYRGQIPYADEFYDFFKANFKIIEVAFSREYNNGTVSRVPYHTRQIDTAQYIYATLWGEERWSKR